MKESDLFEPIQKYLQGQGYDVHSEVRACDIVARKGDDLIIIELKRNMSLQLVIQGVLRKELNDSVYLAVPILPGKITIPNFKGVKALLKRLEIGLIFVRFMKTKTKVEIVFHPSSYNQRRRHKKRYSIVREIDGRFAEFNKAGEASYIEKVTAYKQKCLMILDSLSGAESKSPKELREEGFDIQVGTILSQNIYGWYERLSRGCYRLSEIGREALMKYQVHLEEIKKK